MSDQVKVTWEINDGYAGKSRPQYTYIDREDWDACEGEKERQDLIDDCVQNDYDNLGYFIESVDNE